MSRDITVIPYEYIVTFTKTDNISVQFADGDYICEVEENRIDLVRCKDCRHYRNGIPCVGGQYNGCEVWLDNGNEIEVSPYHFCSYGERRE